MSAAYQIGSVTVTPAGGGWYEITHPTLPEPLKVQGKENADAQAQQLADSLAAGMDQGGENTALQQQPPLDAVLAQQAASGSENLGAADDEVAALKEQLAATQAARAEEMAAKIEAEKRAELAEQKLATKTVVVGEGEVPTASRIPAAVPRAYTGILDDKEKARLKALGVQTTEIILEENESIPPTGLFLGHNGRGYQITPGEPVTVPNFLLNVLNDAVMSAPVVDSKTQKVLGYRNRMKYPYRLV